MHLSSDTTLNGIAPGGGVWGALEYRLICVHIGRAVCVIPKLWGGPGYQDVQKDDYHPEDPVTRWQGLVFKM